jgi:hypothetical protein
MRSKRTLVVGLAVWVVALFAAGAVWRAFNPLKPDAKPDPFVAASRQEGYYLCFHRPRLTDAERRALIARRLPKDDPAAALTGCQEAQRR